MFAIALVVNVGMFTERVQIVVPSLARRNDPSIWGTYFPTWVEISFIVGSIAMFALIYTLFSKLFPVVAISDVKEQLFHTTDRTIGGANLSTVVSGEGKEGGRET
jgi:molybdopterin-containing oxidoreductase family membrane subunit